MNSFRDIAKEKKNFFFRITILRASRTDRNYSSTGWEIFTRELDEFRRDKLFLFFVRQFCKQENKTPSKERSETKRSTITIGDRSQVKNQYNLPQIYIFASRISQKFYPNISRRQFQKFARGVYLTMTERVYFTYFHHMYMVREPRESAKISRSVGKDS